MPPWLTALNARSQALNKRYKLGQFKPQPKPRPAAPADPFADVNKSVEQIIQTLLGDVQREQDAARAVAEREANQRLAEGQALAYGLKQLGIAPAVQAAFQNAGQAQAALAQGFSGATRDAANAFAADQQRQLSGTGQEAAVRNQGDAMGNVQYGLGGYIPATALNTTGAAFGAQAALQPGFALQFGQLAKAERDRQWADELMKFAEQRADVIAKKPELAREMLTDAAEAKAKADKEAWDRRYKTTKLKSDQKLAQAKLKAANAKAADQSAQGWARIQQGDARIQQGDARLSQSQQALELRAQQYAQSNAQAWARIGVSDRNAQISASRNELAWKKWQKGDKAGARKSGLTPYQVRQLRKEAGNIASDAWNGVNPQQDGSREYMSYQEAMREGLARGVPLSLMQAALNRFWTKPGVLTQRDVGPDGKPLQGSGRPKVPFQLRQPKQIKNTRGIDAGSQIVGDALEFGPGSDARYVFGAEMPGRAFDCSGYTKFMVKRHTGVDLPHQARAQFYDPRGKSVPTPALQPGDLVFFTSSPNGQGDGPPYHVGYYIGNGKYVEYYSRGKKARVSNLTARSDYMGARRF